MPSGALNVEGIEPVCKSIIPQSFAGVKISKKKNYSTKTSEAVYGIHCVKKSLEND
jgi:hypothetical protein